MQKSVVQRIFTYMYVLIEIMYRFIDLTLKGYCNSEP